ncbi:MAG: peptidase M23, partial [Nitrososphaerales archaeon]
MVEVASSMGVSLYAPSDGFVSFFNSPYHPHIELSALDIYTGSRRFGSEALSPVRGRVRRIYAFEPPASTWFNAPKLEHLVLIECFENEEVLAKILHIQPSVKEGDEVDVGSPLGYYIRDGYFHPWTDPHMHIELKRCSDPLRARGGYRLKPLITKQIYVDGALDEKKSYSGIVVKLGERYVIVDLDAPFAYLEPFFGLAAQTGYSIGLIDGGVPHYQWAGLLGLEYAGISSDIKILNTF